MNRSLVTAALAASISLMLPSTAWSADVSVGPSDYQAALSALQPGDTLHLASGTYPDRLNINGLNGTDTSWITIAGPETGDPAVFLADPGPCCNTIEITNSSYVAIQYLTVDAQGVEGASGVSAKGSTGNLVHHITVEGCTFLNHDASQQTVAISTKTPTWGWTIRGNRILGAGTGMYLGDSNGAEPFVGGLIENNLITDTVGYNMEIKWQQPRPAVSGMPTGPSTTILRHNVFIKSDRPSPDGDRPNVLVGGFPHTGAGSEDRYELYGNVFFHNPRASLLQASGRVSIHDNVFVDVVDAAIRLQNHNLPLRMAHVYNNTIYAAGLGIWISGTVDQGSSAVGNLIFADAAMSGTFDDDRDNVIDAITNASQYVTAPSTTLGQMDFYPLAGTCEGSALDLSAFAADTDYDRDFNGTPKGGLTFRGAYAGDGTNPGWSIDEGIKGTTGSPPPDGGTGGGGTGGTGGGGTGGTGGSGTGGGGTGGASGSAGSTGGAGGGSGSGGTGGTSVSPDAGTSGSAGSGGKPSGAAPSSEEASGCACRAGRGSADRSLPLAWLSLSLLVALRRRR